MKGYVPINLATTRGKFSSACDKKDPDSCVRNAKAPYILYIVL